MSYARETRWLNGGTRVKVGRSMVAVAIASASAGLVLGTVGFGTPQILWDEWLVHNAAAAIGFSLIAWFVLPGQPRNGAVWTSAWVGFFAGLYCLTLTAAFRLAIAYGMSPDELYASSPSDFPSLAAVIPMMASGLHIPFLLALTAGLLLFPDGLVPSPRWRWVLRASIIVIAADSLALMWLFRPTSTVTFGSLATVADMFDLGPLLAALEVMQLVLVPVCAFGMFLRYRRSAGSERQQFRSIAWGAVAAVVLMVAATVVDLASSPPGPRLLFLLAIVIMIGSYGIAIARYRLYDVDVVISRTLVLAALAVFITLTYALVVVVLGRLIHRGSDDLLLQITATGMVAVAFEPVRVSAQRWANRLVYGSRATPYEVLADLTERLSSAGGESGPLERLAELLRDGTGAELATVWLGDPGSSTPAVSAPPGAEAGGDPEIDEDATFAVSHDGEPVGALQVRKARGHMLSTAERALIADLAGSAGALLGYQRLNDSLEAKADQLELSRARLFGAQDQERRKLERELHEGAEQYIVALKVKLGVARQLASRAGADDLVELLEGLTSEAQAALDDVQSLAKGIYPPILESDGLAAAISALASSTPVDIHVERNGIGRYLPEVEAAVYFDVSEAITNAVKHADPPVRVELTEEGQSLKFTVEDGGPGFDVDALERGSGLENMSDRLAAIGGVLTVDSRSGSRTRIHGEIPVIEPTPM